MNQNSSGEWIPEIGKYRKTCSGCPREFDGRKNQIYCSLKCKARENNNLAAVRTRAVVKHTAGYVKNMEILEQEFQKAESEVATVPMNHLISLGFDATAPYTPFAWKGQRWSKVGDYGFRILPKTENTSQQVEIVKIQ
jgi:hypothetical protein